MTLKRCLTCVVLILLHINCQICAIDRVSRKFDSTNGPILAPVFELAQDPDGFIWIGTTAGLLRYDGSQIRPWAKNVIVRDVNTITTSPQGEIVVAENRGTLYRVIADGVEPVAGPDAKPIKEVGEALFDRMNRLWVKIAGGDLLMRDERLKWHTFDGLKTFPGERITRIRLADARDLFILTDKAIWQRDPEGNLKQIIAVERPIDVVSDPAGSIFVLSWGKTGRLIESRQGRVVRTIDYPARPMDLVIRGQVVWAAFDRFLISLDGNAPPKVIAAEDDLPSGGPLLVDNEGSLWLGTFSGLLQFPEPQTTVITHQDGLGNNHLRWVSRTDEGLWVSYWGGLTHIQFINGEIKSDSVTHGGSRGPCIDHQGNTWSYSREGDLLQRNVGGSFVRQASPELGGFYMCEATSTRE